MNGKIINLNKMIVGFMLGLEVCWIFDKVLSCFVDINLCCFWFKKMIDEFLKNLEKNSFE